jgi:hypothetical protein
MLDSNEYQSIVEVCIRKNTYTAVPGIAPSAGLRFAQGTKGASKNVAQMLAGESCKHLRLKKRVPYAVKFLFQHGLIMNRAVENALEYLKNNDTFPIQWWRCAKKWHLSAAH